VVQDEDGAVRIVGRLSTDILKVGGYKISAREVEEAVAALPFVREVAVIGVPDEEWGQRVVACVVLAEPLGEQELLARLGALDLQPAKRPREVRVVDALPRNAMGKVQKHLLAEG
jgi:acyl-coenzyme A synthetase/AMP-(fatty) acid ligase